MADVTRILVPYHLDDDRTELDWPIPTDLTVHSTVPADPEYRWDWLGSLYSSVSAAVAGEVTDGTVPVVVSGDCTTSLGTVAGLQHAGVDPVIVWFDGHGDVQTLETTTSGYLGGLPLRILVGYRPELISTTLGLRPIPEERAILVDARDLDPPEATYLATAAIRRVPVPNLSTMELPDGPIYLHVDLDVITPDELPGLIFPAAGGPGLEAVFAAIDHVWSTGRVAAVGLACTWHPHRGSADVVRPHLERLFG